MATPTLVPQTSVPTKDSAALPSGVSDVVSERLATEFS